MNARLRLLVAPALFAALGFALLTSLGVWQLQRLAWKEGLLAQIDARLRAPVIALPLRDQWPKLSQTNDEYRHVAATGVFDNDNETYVFRTAGSGLGEAGYLVLTPLRLAEGDTVLVNRGFVPERLRDPATRVADRIDGATTVKGALRWPEERNAFTPADDPVRGVWYTRDPVAIAKAIGITEAAPFSIDADPDPNAQALRGGATVVAIRNDHLSYAMTWFGLAATLVVMFALFAWRRLRGG